VKLLDANILLYAYDASSAHHLVCKNWLEGTLNADEPVGLPWQTSLAFIRIATNPRAVRAPIATEAACAIIASLLERPTIVVVEPGEQFWQTFVRLVAQARVNGPLVTDAVLAALAVEQGASLCSTDRDFKRFEGLTIFDPTRTD
jgi:uncharacterized protein